RPQGTRHYRRYLQFGLHAGVRHRADEQDMRDAAREPRLPPGVLRQGLYLRDQGHQRRRDFGPDVLLSPAGEGLDPPQWRADHRKEEDKERNGSLEDRRSLSKRFLIFQARSFVPDITGTRRPAMRVAVTVPSSFSACATGRRGAPFRRPGRSSSTKK